MKKSEIRKLRLSRETLKDLQDLDFRKLAGGVVTGSCQSCPWCTSYDDTDTCGTT